MKKLFFIIFLLISVNSYAQTNSSYHYKIPSQIKDGLQTASLSEVGIDSNKIISLTNKILENTYINIHSVLIIRDNKLVYENYFPGQEDLFYGDSSIISHHVEYVHECRSISKSVVSACIGIAIAQGKIKSVNERVLQYFPEYARYDTGMKQSMTIRDLLTMSSGIQWNEGGTSATNQENTMMRSNNPVEYFLSQPMAVMPGKVWNYNSGCTQILGAIIKKTTGEEIDSFANKNIFLPLGIKAYKWDKTKEGFRWCASGLRLTSRDMAKFGLLYLNKGVWENKKIIPVSWVDESLSYYFTGVAPETNYGYQFWGADILIDNEMVQNFAAMGNGGQIVLVMPTKSIEIVVTAGNYYARPDQTFTMIANEIFPAIKIKKTKNPN